MLDVPVTATAAPTASAAGPVGETSTV
jgi:hypothetical protein